MKHSHYQPLESQPIISVKLAITTPSRNYLLLTRAAKDKNRPGTIDLPGGGVDAGETPLQACFREAKEELGIILPAERLELRGYLERPSSYGHINQRHFWHVILTEENPNLVLNPQEHSAFQWLPLSEAYASLSHPPLREGFALATGMIGFVPA